MERYTDEKSHYYLEGMAQSRGLKNNCQKKLCLYSTDRQFLMDLLFDLSKENDCYKIKITKNQKLSVTKGECYFTNESAVGDYWAKYADHPNSWCTVEDDAFEKDYKDNIRSY